MTSWWEAIAECWMSPVEEHVEREVDLPPGGALVASLEGYDKSAITRDDMQIAWSTFLCRQLVDPLIGRSVYIL